MTKEASLPGANPLPIPEYEYITKRDRAEEVLEEISTADIVEVDTEATSLDPYCGRLSLLQLGVYGKAYVFDLRHDTEFSDIDLSLFKDLLTSDKTLKLLQNAKFDMKYIKIHGGYYIKNVYDTMLAEQLITLGKGFGGNSLANLVRKYLGLVMNKEPRDSFSNYYQPFERYQLDYAATDVAVLTMIYDQQISAIKEKELLRPLELELTFLKAMCELELNGIKVDTERWRAIMTKVAEENEAARAQIERVLGETNDQQTLFGVSSVNLDSPKQLLSALNAIGIKVENTSEGTLKKFKKHPVIKNLLDYRKTTKLVGTYGEALLAKINKKTGRLHTDFKQMVETGRMSSSNPNLQNIPAKHIFRSCFIAKPGCVLLTADMDSAELKILGNLSQDPTFIKCCNEGIDLHTYAASYLFDTPYEKVTTDQRKASKAITFGLCYGMSKYGLAARLNISEREAEKLLNGYFKLFPELAKFLHRSAKEGVRKGYSTTISGRKRFYNIPPAYDPSYKSIVSSVERKSKNTPIQGSNADVTKNALIICVDRLEKLDYYAKVLLTVHDEIVVETLEEKKYEVANILEQSIIDGFAEFFSLIPMTTKATIGPCWLKGECSNNGKGCENPYEIEFVGEGLDRKLKCKSCGKTWM